MLGIDRTGRKNKKAYRKLARQYHPDVNRIKTEEKFKRFKKLTMFSDPKKKAL